MQKMPVLFVGHGSPMNAIENNRFSEEWKVLGKKLPRPEAILSVSAHWYTKNSWVTDSESPKTVYDMYGFPDELYKIVYGAKGAPELAHKTQKLISRKVGIDNSWGCDHGTWSVLHRMYPLADVPVFQLSVDGYASPAEHYQMGRELSSLREEGVLIMGSGNVVHNLREVDWDMEEGGYPWAEEFDLYIKENILAGKDENVVSYEKAGSCAPRAVPYSDHYSPLLYALGASEGRKNITVFNEGCVLGSLSMTSYIFE